LWIYGAIKAFLLTSSGHNFGLKSFNITINILLYEGLETKWGNNGYSPWGGEVIKRGQSDVKEYISCMGIGYPAERKDILGLLKESKQKVMFWIF
jgi:hypothetical protein